MQGVDELTVYIPMQLSPTCLVPFGRFLLSLLTT